MRNKVTALAALLSTAAFAQNLVVNPTLHSETDITNYDQVAKVSGISNANEGTVDICSGFADANTVGIPTNNMGYQETEFSSRYAGIIAYHEVADAATDEEAEFYNSYSEYIQLELVQSLEREKTYHVSFQVSLAERSKFATQVGAFLSTEQLAYSGNKFIDKRPDFKTETAITDTKGWVTVEADYTALGGEKFITIGSFGRPNAKLVAGQEDNNWARAYYYLYNFKVEEVIVEEPEPIDFASLLKGQSYDLPNFYFETNSAVLEVVDYTEMDQLAEWLKANPEVVINVEGHTDATGTNKVNQRLSEQRAQAVKNYLLHKGVLENQMLLETFRDTKLAVKEGPAKNRENRRASISLVEPINMADNEAAEGASGSNN